MTIYRTCPSYPAYEAARDGSIRRLPWVKVTKTGKRIDQPGSSISHVGRDRAYVTLGGTFVRWQALVDDAWPDDDRPTSSYPNGVVMTVAEYWEMLRSRTNC